MLLSPSGCCDRAFALAAIAVGLLASAAHAQCPTVINVPADAPSINEAVAMVCANTTAEIVVAAGTWSVEVNSAKGSDITIRGAGAAVTTLVPVAGGWRFVTNVYWDANTVLFEDATLQGGSGDNFNTSLRRCNVEQSGASFFPDWGFVEDCNFSGCDATYSTLYVQRPATIVRCSFTGCNEPVLFWNDLDGEHVLKDCTFVNTGGSALRCWGPRLVHVEGCVFDNSKGGAGRAIEFEPPQPAPATTRVLEIEDCTFTKMGGTALNGGAIHIGKPAVEYTSAQTQTTITGCTFEGCIAADGGAVYALQNQPVDIASCVFTGNTATGVGGALSWQFGGWYADWAVANSLFSGNSAVFGGAIAGRGWDGDLTLATCEFQGNIASDSGGAVSWDRLRLHATECDFVGNSALSWAGGATTCDISRPSTFTGCSFVSNSAGNRGGACSTYYYSDTTFQNCTFVGNGSGEGSALDFHSISTAQLIACGFEGNIASPGGSTLHLRGTDNGDLDIIISDCSFNGSAAPAGTNLAVSGSQTAVVSSSTVCGHGLIPFAGAVTDAGGNCIVESCADGDGNGTPDECQVVSVPGDYATIQGAIDGTPKGEFRIVSVAPGTYAGPIDLLGKSIRLIGSGGAAVTTISGTSGQSQSVIRAISGEPATSLIKGFTIRGGSTGSPLPSLPSANCGGGLLVFNSQISVQDCIFTDNEAAFGGGAYLLGHAGSITNCTFDANIAQAYGGGLQLFNSSTRITNCSVTNNVAVTAGGGVHMVSNTPTVVNCTITGNDCYEQGGGVSWDPVNSGSVLTLQQTMVTNNIADVIGGGIYIYPSGVASETRLVGTTVCGNSGRNISGAYQADGTSHVCDCFADINGDALVNGIDLAVVLSTWGTDGGATWQADVNRDGTVDGFDLAIVLSGWGTCAP